MIPKVVPARPDLELVLARLERAPVLLPRRIPKVLVDGALVPREVVLGAEAVVVPAAARLVAEVRLGMSLVVLSVLTVSFLSFTEAEAQAYFRADFVFTISLQCSHCSLDAGFVSGAAEPVAGITASRGPDRSNATRPNCDDILWTSGSKVSSLINEVSSL